MPQFFRKIFLALFLALTLSVYAACQSSDNGETGFDTVEIFAMDTVISIKAYGTNTEKALDAAVQEIYRLEKLFSVTEKDSEIYKLNSLKSITASDEVVNLFTLSQEISAKTDGAFDISVYPLVSLYGFTKGEYRVPEQSELEAALGCVGYEHILIQGDKIEIPSGAGVDLGAIAKGYCGDRVAAVLEQNDVSSAVISIGGNVRLLGQKPDADGYSIAIRDPNDTQEYIGSVTVSDCSVVTSGSYQRYFEENGRIYHHIIDPKTGLCADSGLSSVTVICKDGATADALSTAFFVMGQEQAEQYCRQTDEISAIFVSDNKEISVIGEVDFTPVESSEYTYSTAK